MEERARLSVKKVERLIAADRPGRFGRGDDGPVLTPHNLRASKRRKCWRYLDRSMRASVVSYTEGFSGSDIINPKNL